MKKLTTIILFYLLTLTLLFSLAACGYKCEHMYSSVCDEICNECSEERTTTVEHNYYGDCDGICHGCGNKREVTVGHNWMPATCERPEACEGCGACIGNVLEHDFTALDYDDHYHFTVCARCKTPEGEDRAKHALDDEYSCECGVQYTTEIFSGELEGYNTTVVSLYNSDGMLVKRIEYINNELGKTIEYYFENGNLIKEESYLADGSLDEYTLYTYDERGNEIKREVYLGDGTLVVSTILEYDESGNKINEIYKDSEGNVTVKEYGSDEN